MLPIEVITYLYVTISCCPGSSRSHSIAALSLCSTRCLSNRFSEWFSLCVWVGNEDPLVINTRFCHNIWAIVALLYCFNIYTIFILPDTLSLPPVNHFTFPALKSQSEIVWYGSLQWILSVAIWFQNSSLKHFAFLKEAKKHWLRK